MRKVLGAATNSEGTSAYGTAVSFFAGVLTGDITASRTLYSDTLYTLSGYVKVQPAARDHSEDE